MAWGLFDTRTSVANMVKLVGVIQYILIKKFPDRKYINQWNSFESDSSKVIEGPVSTINVVHIKTLYVRPTKRGNNMGG